MRIESDPKCGTVLLEVLLALALFAGAAAVIGIGLKASIDGAERLRMSTHAGNLAVTVISELQIGIRSLAETGPEAFGPPFDGWVWEVAATPWGGSETKGEGLTRVEVIVRHEPTAFVYRLAQVIHANAGAGARETVDVGMP
jgi:type II secretory pathway pseudopilin PulG